jgi:hypothetical protein
MPRWLVPLLPGGAPAYKVESADGVFQIREDAPMRRPLPDLHKTP